MQQATGGIVLPTKIGRMPVYDSGREVWGHELAYPAHDEKARSFFQVSKDRSSPLTDAVRSVRGAAKNRKEKLLIDFPEYAILDKVPLLLPVDDTVVELDSRVRSSDELLVSLKGLKRQGYLLAVKSGQGEGENGKLLDMADIIQINVAGKAQNTLEQLVERSMRHNGLLLAGRVGTHEQADKMLNYGFSLIKGSFVTLPKSIQSRRPTSSETSRIRLFTAIEQEDPNFDQLAKIIEADPVVGFRLLKYLNSPAFGLLKTIESVKQAIVLLGWKRLKSWIRVVILTDLSKQESDQELPYLSFQRAKFLEAAATEKDLPESERDKLFLLGLFSLLDALMEMPMSDVVEALPIDEALKRTLCGEQTGYSPWLALTSAFEGSDWTAADKIMADIRLNPERGAAAYYNALVLAGDFFQTSM